MDTRNRSRWRRSPSAPGFYTNGPGKQEVRGFARCDIAEVLLFNRALSDDEAKKVRAYLDAKHAELKKNLPPEAPASANLLVP